MTWTSLRKPCGKQRADRAVDEAGDERLLLGRAAFTLEEAAGDTAGGVEFLLIIDGQGEEILAGLGGLLAPTTAASTTVSP